MKKRKNSRGFVLSFLISLVFNLEWTVPAWIFLGLHLWKGISLWWFVGSRISLGYRATIITGIFDNRGLIQEGSLIKTQPNGYNENAYFERKSPTGKRLRIEGLTLRVSRGSDEIWSTLPDHSYYRISSDINPKEYYKKIKLADLFFEIIRKNHAIF